MDFYPGSLALSSTDPVGYMKIFVFRTLGVNDIIEINGTHLLAMLLSLSRLHGVNSP